MSKRVKAFFIVLVVSFSCLTLAQDDLQNERIDELFRRYDSLSAEQSQLNQKVNGLEQTVASFDNSVSQLSRTVAALTALVTNQNRQADQQGRALTAQALASSFAAPASIFPNPVLTSAGVENNFTATPGVVVEPLPVQGQPVQGAITSVTTIAPIQNMQVATLAPNVVVTPVTTVPSTTPTPVMVYANTANTNANTSATNAGASQVIINGGITAVPVIRPEQSGVTSGITHVHQLAPVQGFQNNLQAGIQNVNGSSQTLPTGSFSPNPFPSTQSQLPSTRFLQVGAYTDYTLSARHASLLRGLSYPVSERQEGIWVKLLIGPLPMEQINMIKGRLDSQGINSFVTQ